LVGVTGVSLLYHQARIRLRQTRYLARTLAMAGALAGLSWVILSFHQPVQAAYPPHPANLPIGTPRGLAPGRVTWVHNTAVTDWAGPNSGQKWYEHINQTEANHMLEWALESYTNTNTPAAAWDAIFHSFNGGSGYSPGQKIFIKINLTTSNAAGGCADADYNWINCGGITSDCIANSPQLMHVLLDQLVNIAGVAQVDITIGDPTGLFVNNLYNPLHNDFPNVHYLDNRGGLGRTRAEFSTVPFYWSNPAANGTIQDYLPSVIADATYVINFAVLKTHEGGGLTVMGKNLYGALIRTPVGTLRGTQYDYFNLHDWLPGDYYRTDPAMTGMGQYRPLVDLLGQQGTGGKSVLYLVDAIFAGKDWNGIPSKWTLSPFNNNWPASLFLSMDPVAIDSVSFDFLSQKWPDQALKYEGAQDYLHEAALANDPPSGTFYDPERDGIAMASLGVHEHWNNPTQKQYSRNLGSGNGIELVYINATQAMSVARAGTGSGTVISSPPGIDCGLDCSESYSYNTPVTLSASAGTGSTFAGWSGACTGTGMCHVTMNAAKSVTATFTLTKPIFLPLLIR
jgi:hypothetical protein